MLDAFHQLYHLLYYGPYENDIVMIPSAFFLIDEEPEGQAS